MQNELRNFFKFNYFNYKLKQNYSHLKSSKDKLQQLLTQMSTTHNIFPQLEQQSPNIIRSRVAPYKQIVDANRLKLKTIEAQYLQNEYKNILTAKERQKQAQRQQRQMQRQIADSKKQSYRQEMQRQMQRRQLQKAYLAFDYKNTIDYQQQKKRNQKQASSIVQKQILSSPTWIRDASSQRQTNKVKKLYYNQLLDEHLLLQQERKINQKIAELKQQEKLKRQAEQVMQKQFGEMEARHRQKSLFEQRQNQLLGVGTHRSTLQDSMSFIDKQRLLRHTEKEIYRQGLQAQYQKEQHEKTQRKRNSSENKQDLGANYNPITNPIPFVYKNPNVLRMLNQL